MIINAATSNLNISVTSTSTSTAKLSEEEKKYDYDGDGVLSAAEKSAMLEATAQESVLKSSQANSSTNNKSDSVSISQEALAMLTQSQTQPAQNASEMSD